MVLSYTFASIQYSRITNMNSSYSFVATQVLASHTLWHICVLNAVYCWFHFILQYQHLLSNFQCLFYEEEWSRSAGSGSGGMSSDVIINAHADRNTITIH